MVYNPIHQLYHVLFSNAHFSSLLCMLDRRIFHRTFYFSLRNVAMGTSTAWARVSGFASAYAPLLVRFFAILSMLYSNLYRVLVCLVLAGKLLHTSLFISLWR